MLPGAYPPAGLRPHKHPRLGARVQEHGLSMEVLSPGIVQVDEASHKVGLACSGQVQGRALSLCLVELCSQ